MSDESSHDKALLDELEEASGITLFTILKRGFKDEHPPRAAVKVGGARD